FDSLGPKLWNTDISTTAMTSQRIRFFAMSLKGLTSYYNCVKNSVRILYVPCPSHFRLKDAGYHFRPVATIYTSRERAREESGLRTLTFANRERISLRYSSKPSP